MNNKYTKDLVLLGALIIGCSILARYMASGETLAEYDKAKAESSIEATVQASVQSSEDIGKESASSYMTSASESNSSASSSDSAEIGATVVASTSNDSTTAEASKDASNNENIAISDRVNYMDGFYYESLSQGVIAKITGISYVDNDNVSLDDLRYCSLLYNDFDGNTQTGEMICNKKIAQDVIEIFAELYSSGYQIESIKLIDEFGGDDTASMEANNTSCFNYRVVDGTTRLSNHAYGLAIDLNPYYNPYITYNKDGSTNVSPEGSRIYEDRSASFPYKIDENDLAYKLFKEHGFKWGGDWNSVKDYQHFEKK